MQPTATEREPGVVLVWSLWLPTKQGRRRRWAREEVSNAKALLYRIKLHRRSPRGRSVCCPAAHHDTCWQKRQERGTRDRPSTRACTSSGRKDRRASGIRLPGRRGIAPACMPSQLVVRACEVSSVDDVSCARGRAAARRGDAVFIGGAARVEREGAVDVGPASRFAHTPRTPSEDHERDGASRGSVHRLAVYPFR